jgi:hypothetical protein
MFFRRKPKPKPTADSLALRDMALRVMPSELGLTPQPERPHVWGALMETGYDGGVASLVSFADGSTSMYFSNGGGIIGAGQHDAVRAAAETWLSSAEECLPNFVATVGTPLPGVGRVRFYVHTFEGVLTAEADEQDLGHGRHELAPFFHRAHRVISAMREASERTQRR